MPLKHLTALLLCLGAAATHADSGSALYARGDFAAAAREFAAAAERGDRAARNNLGVMYLRGKGVARDYARARGLFEAAAAQALPGAMFNLGMIHLRGYGVARDPAAAAGWFRQAAEQGDREAQFFLAVMLVKGDGIPADAVRARQWFAKSAAAGLAAAQYNLAMLYLQEGDGEAEARRWLEAAAEQDHRRARLTLARLDLAHADDPVRAARAADLMGELARGGDAEAQMQFGLMHLFGHGLPRDPEEGRFWLRQSALQGFSAAQLNLAAVYAEGIGTAADAVQAFAWLTLAAEGDDAARPVRDAMAKDISAEQRAAAEAMAGDLRRKAAAP